MLQNLNYRIYMVINGDYQWVIMDFNGEVVSRRFRCQGERMSNSSCHKQPSVLGFSAAWRRNQKWNTGYFLLL